LITTEPYSFRINEAHSGVSDYMVKLDVERFGQAQPYQCVPACIKMVLEFLGKNYGDNIPRLSVSKISRIVKTMKEGTIPKDVERINEILCKGNPVVEFKAKLLGRFPEISQELEDNKNPVIVWINTVEPPDVVWHAVAVIGFDPETNKVVYNDPWDNKEKTEDVGTFSKKWGVEGRMVKVKIRKTHQRHVDEWAPQNVEGETDK
jgi:uncharacterized protein YvpB